MSRAPEGVKRRGWLKPPRWIQLLALGALLAPSLLVFAPSASVKFNTNDVCSGASGSLQGSYTVDNTGPVVSAALTPAANAAGWNNSSVTVNWTATDAGVGVAGAQPFKSTSY